METIITLLISFSFIFLYLGIFAEKSWIKYSSIFMIWVTLFMCLIVNQERIYKISQIDALKGKYKYKMNIFYEKRLEFSIQDSVVIDSNECRLSFNKDSVYKIYYESYYPDTIWEVVFIPIDTQYVKL